MLKERLACILLLLRVPAGALTQVRTYLEQTATYYNDSPAAKKDDKDLGA